MGQQDHTKKYKILYVVGFIVCFLSLKTILPADEPTLEELESDSLENYTWEDYSEDLYSSKREKALKPRALVFDVGDTLLKTGFIEAAQIVGIPHFVKFFAEQGPECIDVFKCINLVNDQVLDDILATDPNHAHDPIKKAWFEGRRLNTELLATAYDLCDQYPHFRGESHRELTKRTFDLMFKPDNLVKTRVILHDMVAILKEAAEVTDESGKPLHKLFILSNWEPESWEKIYNAPEFQEVFKYFPPENVFVSCYLKDSKPNQSIFNTVVETAGINPEDAILLDDLQENIEAARKAGWHAVWRDKNGYDEDVRKQLEDLDVF